MTPRLTTRLAVLALAALAAGCGGGSGSEAPAHVVPRPSNLKVEQAGCASPGVSKPKGGSLRTPTALTD